MLPARARVNNLAPAGPLFGVAKSTLRESEKPVTRGALFLLASRFHKGLYLGLPSALVNNSLKRIAVLSRHQLKP